MRVLITGSNGQLGSEIKELAANYDNIECIYKDLPKLDICDADLLNVFITDYNINVVINCAAYTAVDKAEKATDIAEQVNSTGVSNLVNALEKINGKLIHISTDYVFDGNHLVPYKESDLVSPIGVYGKSKRAGELAVISSNIDAIVIRTSWLYSSYGNNFVKTMQRLANDRDVLNVVDDQIGAPTYAKELASACLTILNATNWPKQTEVYHYSNEGSCSWCEFAKTILEFTKSSCKVLPITTKEYPTPAPRPAFSVLDKSKIKEHFNLEISSWQECLRQYTLNESH